MKPTSTDPHPLDVALGSRIRLRRRELGMSQEQLAAAIDVSFQQVQKYEHGTNRVSFSRLVGIANALDCNAHDLIGTLAAPQTDTGIFSDHVAHLNVTGAAELLKAYSATSPKHRRAILNLAKQLAGGKQ